MKKIVALLVVCLFACGISSGQTFQRCATHEVFRHNAQKNSGYAKAIEHAFNYAKDYGQRISANKTGTWDTIYRIPVVVHIVYNTAEQNLHDSLICNQIEVLNQDYRRLNPDTSSTRIEFQSLAADAGIEFFLATTDPQGNPTTGVTRDSTAREYFSVLGGGGTQNGADEVKNDSTGGVSPWDTEKYLNIWVCNLEDPTLPFGAVLGFSYPPDNAPNWPQEAFPADPGLHGVVIHYKVFGRNNPLAIPPLDIAKRGRTATHEIGHFLGLRHIWGDGPLSVLGIPDCTVDDGINDTPNSGTNSQLEASAASGCSISKNTCTDSSNDLPDMWENYMDYSKEECQNTFTRGQVAILRAMLAISRTQLAVLETPAESSLCAPAVSSIKPVEEMANFIVYPNPSGGQFTIQTTTHLQPSQISVADMVGKRVNAFRLDEVAKGKYVFTATDFPKGVYFIRLETQEAFAVKKVVVE